jgi:hypothetical protein
VSGICDLPLTDAGRAAVERHRAALANGDLQEWRRAYPAMVAAITESYVRLRRADSPPTARTTSSIISSDFARTSVQNPN